MSPSFALRERPEYVAWFALPMSTAGLLILCREQLSRNEDGHIHPLATALVAASTSRTLLGQGNSINRLPDGSTAAQLTAALLACRGDGPAGQDDRGDFGGERHAHHGG